ncbi:MAG: PRC-barrel domain-containing protein [Verrucomicrobia bacterium]|nr:PRC-barrel domain-containing protein [Verrucomicrobiota bacterium]
MVQNVTQLIGKKLGAADGDVGYVKDFYLDDEAWVVRYLAVDTEQWLGGREVLFSPPSFGARAFGFSRSEPEVMRVTLNRQRIEKSPALGTVRPVSRAQEAAYCRHYGWPPYWLAAGAEEGVGRPLLSGLAAAGFRLRALDGKLGKVTGFQVDDKTWGISALMVDIGPWYRRKTILVGTGDLVRIVEADAVVEVALTRGDILATARNQTACAQSARV